MRINQVMNCFLAGALAGTMCLQMAAQSKASSSSATSAPATKVEGASGYDQPPKSILDGMMAPPPQLPAVSRTHDTILLISMQDYPPISRVATPFLRLAGARVEPKNHSKHDTAGGY